MRAGPPASRAESGSRWEPWSWIATVAAAVLSLVAIVVTVVQGCGQHDLSVKQTELSGRQTRLSNQQTRLQESVEARASSPILAALMPPARRGAPLVAVSTIAGRKEKYRHRPLPVRAKLQWMRAPRACKDYWLQHGGAVAQPECWELVMPVRNIGEGMAAVHSVKALTDCGPAADAYMDVPLSPKAMAARRLGVFNVLPGGSEQIVWDMQPPDGRRAVGTRTLYVIVRYTDFHVQSDRWTCIVWRGKYWTFDSQFAGERPVK